MTPTSPFWEFRSTIWRRCVLVAVRHHVHSGDASTRFGWLGEPAGSSGFFDIGTDTTHLAGVRLVDAGDVDVHLEAEITRERTTTRALSIVEHGIMLASIGGDHSVSFPLIRAFKQYGPLTIILLDAHLDYRNKSMEMDFSNNSPFRRARELDFIKRIVTIGVRGIKSTDREYRESLEHGNLVFTMERVHEQEFRASSKRLGLSETIT